MNYLPRTGLGRVSMQRGLLPRLWQMTTTGNISFGKL
jgi:hypothetical protein